MRNSVFEEVIPLVAGALGPEIQVVHYILHTMRQCGVSLAVKVVWGMQSSS